MYQQTTQEVTYKGYPIQYLSAISSRFEEIDKNEALDSVLSILIGEKQLRQHFLGTLLSLLEVDFSSVRPYFEIKRETSLVEEAVGEKPIPRYISEEDILLEMIEHDFVVRMPPKKRYTIELEVKNIIKGEPRIAEPEEF